MSDTLDTIGTIIGHDAKRDAVHVAVIPAVAVHELRPGEHVGILSGARAAICENPVGIVDPYLRSAVKTDDTFWLFLYPRQITSLRHVWSHPAFPEEGGTVPEPAVMRFTKEESEAWLRSFTATADCPEYETTIAAAAGEPLARDDEYGTAYELQDYGGDDSYLLFKGRNAHGDIPSEFWDHLENLKGRKLKRAKYFSCSC